MEIFRILGSLARKFLKDSTASFLHIGLKEMELAKDVMIVSRGRSPRQPKTFADVC